MNRFDLVYFREKNINSAAYQYFFTLWTEQTYYQTKDTYRFRSMNTHTILVEIANTLANHNIRLYHLDYLIAEAESLINNDRILINKFYTASIKQYLIQLRAKLSNDKEKEKIDRRKENLELSVLISIMNSTYFDELYVELEHSLESQPIDFDRIRWSTTSTITELMYQGYSTDILYKNIINSFTENITVPEIDRLHLLYRRCSKVKENYEICFIITTSDTVILPEHTLNCSFYTDETKPESINDLVRLLPDYQGKRIYCVVQTNECNHIAAAQKAKNEVQKVIDIMKFSFQRVIIRFDDHFSYRKNDLLVYCDELTSRLYGYQISNQTSLNITLQSLADIKTSHYDDYKQIQNVLRYFRLSHTADSIENQFLNLWIALETMVDKDMQKTNKDDAASFFVITPKILSIDYIYGLLKDLKENFKRYSLHWNDSSGSRYDYRVKPSQLLSLLKNATEQRLLVDVANRLNPLLTNRIISIANFVCSSANISNIINKSYTDIQQNLFRMYRMRNIIVHDASQQSNDLFGLNSHLLSYLDKLLRIILYIMRNDSFRKKNEVIDMIGLTFDNYVKILHDDTNNLLDTKIIVSPLNMTWPKL